MKQTKHSGLVSKALILARERAIRENARYDAIISYLIGDNVSPDSVEFPQTPVNRVTSCQRNRVYLAQVVFERALNRQKYGI